jgi:hypothetical protein
MLLGTPRLTWEENAATFLLCRKSTLPARKRTSGGSSYERPSLDVRVMKVALEASDTAVSAVHY